MLQPSYWVALLEIKLLMQDSFAAWLNSLEKSRKDTHSKRQTEKCWKTNSKSEFNQPALQGTKHWCDWHKSELQAQGGGMVLDSALALEGLCPEGYRAPQEQKFRNSTCSKCQKDNVKRPIPNRNAINPLYRAPSTNATSAGVSTKHRAEV